MTVHLKLPAKLNKLFEPFRYKVAHGGRGSGKSWGFARSLIIKAYQSNKPLRILCAREFQNSLKESVHKLLSDQIDALGLSEYFSTTNNEITCTLNGSHFFFYGIRNNPTKIKSTEGIDICWVEEAETVSAVSWEILIPTIRADDSEIWVTFNPKEDDDPTFVKFITSPPPNSYVVEMNWRDNPWFPEVLMQEMETLRGKDIELYNHVWEGKTYSRSEAQIFYDKVIVRPVTPKKGWHGPYYGLDWGFGNDPMRLMRVWVFDHDLYIEREVDGKRIDVDNIPDHLRRGDPHCSKYAIRADNSRPETISYVQQHGMPKVVACRKGAGSVMEGITFIRSFRKIIIDPSCRKTIDEARLYRYKVDKLSGDVLPDIVDAYNHSWDAVRYALEPLVPTGRPGAVKVNTGR